MKPIFSLIVAIICLEGCSNPVISDKPVFRLSDYKAQIEAFRKQKNNEFASSPGSPFANEPGFFTALIYFASDTAYRIKATLIPYVTGKRTDSLYDSKGAKRGMVSPGIFEIVLKGQTLHLTAYFDDPEQKNYFLMFHDKTNGKETYGGGRYIEFPVPKSGDELIIDFNMAFNPYCHYSHRYSCPLVPKENFLNLEIKAGEMLYGEAE